MGQKKVKKAERVKLNVVKATITFQDYLNCLFDGTSISREQRNIRSRLRVIYSELQYEVALSAHDDKRCLKSGEIDTLPRGHRDACTNEEEPVDESGAATWRLERTWWGVS
ncbi:hypothetical protein QAD02_007692 [Eretmocerus hayati]|uniref:Uncharacterized protein n=1 Tax=Eretmocerus hayati TaxID=131215 RepID=A0ACC2N8Q7_9HYME|nr:hypothetical protein QAD02_007692 [Eretmocerus hayati]